jgi:hypothetical protein
MAAKTFIIYNAAMATTAAPVKQPTGTAIRTMMQLAPATGWVGRPVAWGVSMDSTTANTPGIVELIETGTVFATALSTAYAAADIQVYGDANTAANTAGSSGVPFNLGTGLSGFSTGAVTEGSTTTTRMCDLQELPPTAPYLQQWPLGREFEIKPGNALRVRATFGTTVNMTCWVIVEF